MPYVAGRPLSVDGKTYQPGEVVPGAENWLRLESRIATGRLKWVDEVATAAPTKAAAPKKKTAKKATKK